ncbi:response regulator transcription factor [Mucilaginibacter lappiensis]|uniref:DNA-binding NarL/FixJ family response regulator n=1 Tax=Mucilaginibacter lappiensis TaxID=354630 RepID=A0A1N6PFZ8_9SPHI|nr:response regulator transcription factor [Mucilaginibacter lappiensis]MBB6107597.1 DNA-binding NarL/FixJ family response regulator [Mucilaginibacter lappiensis]MBB6126083.1 DNA-binding NarL/FixJ family response regulator [Mucilaginibacter lappiensis]SIQ03278.1 two component transcriptional regulator, LuxR family [Mucilaginibacter lappiensis]
MIHIILAEDHHIVRGGIKSLLEKEKDFVITGEATNGADVLDLLNKGTNADIILADMNMPVMGGLELTERIKNDFPQSKVIILSALDHEKYVIKAFQSGASGYLLKSVSPDELIFAIKHTHQHTAYICSELSIRFLNRLLTIPDPVSHENIQDIEFSTREIEILGLIAEGFTNQEIADKLFTSKRTIENHRQTLIDKTNSRNTVALIRFAMLNGII